MILEDLEYIFAPQIAEGTNKLYFMLKDGNATHIERHAVDDLASLLPMLDSFNYAGTESRIPSFIK